MKLGPVEFNWHEPESRDTQLSSMEELLERYDIVDITDDAVILAENPPVTELGTATTRYRQVLGGAEYNNDLRGYTGYVNYDRMRRSDGTISEALKLQKTPILQGMWWVASADPDDDQQNEIAEFVSKALFEWMSIGWVQFLTETLTMLDFGYSYFEKVFRFQEFNGQQKIVWRKFAPRSILDVTEWKFDINGGPQAVVVVGSNDRLIDIDIDRLLVFSYRREGGNIEGISAQREMYKHWYYKENLYKIDAIQKERHGIGIPVIILPPNYTKEDKRLAAEMGRNLRTNEQAHIVLPPFWEVTFAEVKGNPVSSIESIQHHDGRILASVLGGFMGENEKGDAEVMASLFFKASKHIADLVAEVINKFAIPELVDYNYMGVTDYPKLRVRHISEVTDLRTLSFTIRNLIGAGAVKADDKLEEFLRETNDLPIADPSTAREPPSRTTRQTPPPSGRTSQREGNDASGSG